MAVIAPQQNLDRLHWLFVATLLLFAVFTCLFGLSLYTEWRLDRAHERRYQSYLLADELRQSSDDLTRMARSYIASGNPKYLAYYDEILAIRDGRIARPLHYNRIYWDLVFPRQQRPQQRGEPASLLGLMQRGGFSALELARLTEAKQQSDRLTLREREAMAMLARADSLPSREAAALREAARLMLNDEAYFLAKARIMRPIDEVYGLIEQRTAFEVTQAAQQAALVRLAFMLVALGLCLLLLRMRRYSREVLGCNLRQLYGYIVQLGREPPPRIPARSGSDDTVLAWDLDGFKPVNDQHGHAVGDALLQAVAQTLGRLSPPPLCVARVGGDEFVLLLEGGAAVLQTDMQRLVADIAQPVEVAGCRLQVSVSLGLLTFAAGPVPGVDAVLQQADGLMYRAKQQGKNRVCWQQWQQAL